MMKLDEKIVHELRRADFYRLLALCFDAPDEKNRETICQLAKDLDQNRLAEAIEQDGARLETEYTELFLTRVAASPNEGNYHSVERGPILGDVCAFYKAFNIQFRSESGPPDSIKMELAFLSTMALKKVYALQENLKEPLHVTEDAEKKFINDHLGRWVPLFAEQLIAVARSRFYQEAGKLLSQWIGEECLHFKLNPDLLSLPLPSVEREGSVHCAL